MSDRAKSPLAELREVEERLAVRMARIDQLQAAATPSQPRSVRFMRTLAVVGLFGALTTSLFGLHQSHQWALDVLLATASVVLALITGLFSFALRKLVGDHVRTAKLAATGLAIVIRWSPSWHPFPLPSRADRSCSVRDARSRTAPWLFAAAFVAIATVGLLGSVALAIFALLLVSGLLRLMWSRQATVPGMVQVAAVLVSVVAALSVGSWAGGLTQTSFWVSYPPQHQKGTPKAMRAAAEPQQTSPTSDTSQSAPTYESLCGSATLKSNVGASQAIAQLHETWLSAGAIVAGCPGPIYKASAGGEIVASVGRARSGEMKSLGVADRNHGVLFFGQAAAMARNLIYESHLREVPTHLLVGSGDLYLIHTTNGTFILVRKTVSTADNGGATEGTEGGADESQRSGRAYVLVAPAAASLWIGAMAERGEWLWPESPTANSTGEGFEFVTQDSRVVARAWCDRSSVVCEASGSHLRYSGRAASNEVSAEQLLRYAPFAE
jgi:hypothetical protein